MKFCVPTTLAILCHLASAADPVDPETLEKRASPNTRPQLTSRYHEKYKSGNQGTFITCSQTSESQCCYEVVSGFVATQCCNYNPYTGPSNQFTTYDLSGVGRSGAISRPCNRATKIYSASKVLNDAKASGLLQEMTNNWKSNSGSVTDLWTSSYNDFGACMNTLRSNCYSSDAFQYQDAIDYFQTVVSLHKAIPIYQYLSAAGINPSSSKKYTKNQIISAIKASSKGKSFYLRCDSKGALTEVRYSFNLRGSTATGNFVPKDSSYGGNCPDNIWLYPKGLNPTPTTLEVTHLTPTTAITSSSTLGGTRKAQILISRGGCLDANQYWINTTSKCGVYTFSANGDAVSIKGPNGWCGLDAEQFKCQNSADNFKFKFVPDNTFLFSGANGWYVPNLSSNPEGVRVLVGRWFNDYFTMKLKPI